MSGSEVPEPQTVDEYIDAQPAERHDALRQIRRAILTAAPDAVESISYGMPAYRLPNGHPIYFASWKQHLSLHDIPVLAGDLEAEVAPRRSGKDTVRFSHRADVPDELVGRIVAAVAARP